MRCILHSLYNHSTSSCLDTHQAATNTITQPIFAESAEKRLSHAQALLRLKKGRDSRPSSPARGRPPAADPLADLKSELEIQREKEGKLGLMTQSQLVSIRAQLTEARAERDTHTEQYIMLDSIGQLVDLLVEGSVSEREEAEDTLREVLGEVSCVDRCAVIMHIDHASLHTHNHTITHSHTHYLLYLLLR